MKKLLKTTNPWSLGVLTLIVIIIVYLRFCYPWWQDCRIMAWDVFGYYLYLPFTFIYHDTGLKDATVINHIMAVYNPSDTLYQLANGSDGHQVILFTSGWAVMNAPFFFIAHLLAPAFGYTADGFSLPYQFSIAMGGMFYMIVGLIFLRKILLRFFNDAYAALIMLCIALGTNYLELTFLSTPMPHNYLFAVYALLFWYTIRWHETYKVKYAVFIGLLIGLATLVRPSEVISCIIPLLWGVYDKESLNGKLKIIKKYFTQFILLIACAFLMTLPQLIYWKMYTGHYIAWSSGSESFSFLSPYFANVLFSYKKGWLLYTPLMIFAIIGFKYIYFNNKKLFYPLFIFFVLNIWIICSWSGSMVGGGFSQRSFMQSYAIMAIPLGYSFLKISSLKWFFRYLFILVILFFVFLNLFQMWQFMHGVIDTQRTTREYYWKSFLKTKVSDADRRLMTPGRFTTTWETMDTTYNYYKISLLEESFETVIKDKEKYYCDTMAHTGKYSYILDSTNIYSPGFEDKYSNITGRDYMWIKASLYVYPLYSLKENPVSLIVTCEDKGRSIKYRGIDLETCNLKINCWSKVNFEYETPEIRSGNESIKVYVWLRGKEKIFIDDLNVDAFIQKGTP